MNAPRKDDWLESALREGPAYVEDAGFTAQVVAALPSHRKADRQRTIILAGAAVSGCVLGLVVLPGAKFITDCVMQLLTAESFQVSLILPALVVAALIGTALLPVATER